MRDLSREVFRRFDDPTTLPGDADPLQLAPLLCGAGVVRVANLDPARFWKRLADERVTVAVLDPDQAAAVHKAGPDDPSDLRVLLDD